MARRKLSSLLVGFVSCLLASVVAVVLTTTAAYGAPATDKANQSNSGNGNAKTGATKSSDHANANGSSAHENSSSDHSQGNASTQGDPSEPQPQSGADQNSGGANGQCPDGPYCSTRDGSASGNGNGNGEAVGKPCAGCVGKADNKNPQGQKPNGSDANAGYECDTNHGIGRTNPAHTGCSTPNQPPPECVPTAANNNCGPPPECVPTAANNNCGPPPECVPTAANNNCGTPPPSECVPTAANNNCGTPPPAVCVPTAANAFCSNVLGEKVTKPSVTPEVAAETLPFTGTNLVSIVAAGLMALLGGSTLMLIARRSRLVRQEH